MFLKITIFLNIILLADREVQRILLELLNQMDGFDQSINVKVRNNMINQDEFLYFRLSWQPIVQIHSIQLFFVLVV